MGKQSNPFLALIGSIPLFAVILIDGIGSSLVLPVLPQLFSPDLGAFYIAERTFLLSHLGYSISLGIFPLGMFFGAPLLGRLSDLYGRKKTIAYCLVGTFFGYLICGLSIEMKSISLFIFGRLLDGITAGSLPIAQALVIENRPQASSQSNIGLVLFFASAGYALGPLLGRIVNSELGLSLPFFSICLLSLISLLFLGKTREIHKKINDPQQSTSFFAQLLPKVQLRQMFLTVGLFTLFQLGWSGYFQHLSLYLASDLHFISSNVSSVLSILGLGMGVSFCYLAGKASKFFPNHQLISLSGLGILISFVLTLISSSFFPISVLSFCGAIFYGIGYPAIVTFLSTQADENSQGFIFGLAAAVSSLSAFGSALLGTLTNQISSELTLWVSALFILLFSIVGFSTQHLPKLFFSLKKSRKADRE